MKKIVLILAIMLAALSANAAGRLIVGPTSVNTGVEVGNPITVTGTGISGTVTFENRLDSNGDILPVLTLENASISSGIVILNNVYQIYATSLKNFTIEVKGYNLLRAPQIDKGTTPTYPITAIFMNSCGIARIEGASTAGAMLNIDGTYAIRTTNTHLYIKDLDMTATTYQSPYAAIVSQTTASGLRVINSNVRATATEAGGSAVWCVVRRQHDVQCGGQTA